jgi:hypothetical protein
MYDDDAIDVACAASVAELHDSFWEHSGVSPHHTRMRLGDLERDPRFTTRYVAVRQGRHWLAAVPVYLPLSSRWPDPAYDVAAQLHLPAAAPHTFLLIGGRADRRCGMLEVPRAAPSILDSAAIAAARTAHDMARSEGRLAALLYADDDGTRLLRAVQDLGSTQCALLGKRYVITDVGTDQRDYLAGLKSSRRSVVVRDLRDLAAAEICAVPADWEDVLPEAASLIAEIHRSYGEPDLPALARTRLRRRGQDPDAECIAFALWKAGRLQAVTLAWVYADVLELYEVGLTPGPAENRGLRYLEVMFYAPLRFMWQRGLRKLDLAMDAGRPKILRGAIGRDVLGVLLPALSGLWWRRRAVARPVQRG